MRATFTTRLLLLALVSGAVASACGGSDFSAGETADASAGAGGTAGHAGTTDAGTGGVDASAGHAGAGGSSGAGGAGGSGGSNLGGASGSSNGGSAGSGAGGSGGSAGASAGGSGGSAGASAGGSAGSNLGGSAGGDGGILCPSGLTCESPTPTVPPYWGHIGWFDVHIGDACPQGDTKISLYAEDPLLAQQPLSCTCHCQSPGGICTAAFNCGAASMCSNGNNPISVTNTDCSTVANAGSDAGGGQGFACQMSAPQFSSDGGCNPDTVTLGTPEVTASYRGCFRSIAQQAPCTNGICATIPPSGATGPCVAAEGDVACPIGWTTKTVLYTSYTDNRLCTAVGCSCGAVNGSCSCNGTCGVTLYPTDGCSGTPLQTISTACTPVNDATVDTYGARLTGYQPTATCAPDGTPTKSGSVAPNQAITVCCRD
jgi:hypothetical protein